MWGDGDIVPYACYLAGEQRDRPASPSVLCFTNAISLIRGRIFFSLGEKCPLLKGPQKQGHAVLQVHDAVEEGTVEVQLDVPGHGGGGAA